jgi:replicative DNA helicase
MRDPGGLNGGEEPPNPGLELEQQIIGAVFHNHELLDDLLGLDFKSWHFSVKPHEELWDMIIDLHDQNIKPDYTLIAKRFPAGIVFPDGRTTRPYLAHCVSDRAITFERNAIVKKAKCVKARAEALQASYAHEDLQKAIADGEDEETAMLAYLEKMDLIREGLLANAGERTTMDLGELVEDIPAEVRRLRDALQQGKNAAAANALMTGIKEIDDLGGAFAGELWVISARPSNLKTTLADSMALQAARLAMGEKGNTWGFGNLQLEMSPDQTKWRQIADMVNFLDAKRTLIYESLRRGDGIRDDTDLDAIDRAKIELDVTPCIVDFSEDLTVAQIAAKARIMDKRLWRKYKRRLRGLWIDQASFISPPAHLRDNMPAAIEAICLGLKRLAKAMGITIFLLNQQRRAEKGEDRRPTLSKQKWGGAYEEKADVTLMLHYEASYLQGEANDCTNEEQLKQELKKCINTLEVTVGKNRMGRKPRFVLWVFAESGAVRSGRTESPLQGDPVQYADDKAMAAHQQALNEFVGKDSGF